MSARAIAILGLTATLAASACSTKHDPCLGHATPDGIPADQMGPCDEMPGVPRHVPESPNTMTSEDA